MTTRYLMLRSNGCLWAIDGGTVTEIAQEGQGVRVTCGTDCLAADEVVGLSTQLRVRPPGYVLSRWWPHECLGTAVVSGVPVVAVDPRQAPPALLREETESFHGD